MDLNKEAEEYANKNVTKSLHAAYVEGATNSKYVQAEKIKAQIAVLSKIKIAVSDKNPLTYYNIGEQVLELEKQLNELK
jgi:phage I-like protein